MLKVAKILNKKALLKTFIVFAVTVLGFLVYVHYQIGLTGDRQKRLLHAYFDHIKMPEDGKIYIHSYLPPRPYDKKFFIERAVKETSSKEIRKISLGVNDVSLGAVLRLPALWKIIQGISDPTISMRDLSSQKFSAGLQVVTVYDKVEHDKNVSFYVRSYVGPDGVAEFVRFILQEYFKHIPGVSQQDLVDIVDVFVFGQRWGKLKFTSNSRKSGKKRIGRKDSVTRDLKVIKAAIDSGLFVFNGDEELESGDIYVDVGLDLDRLDDFIKELEKYESFEGYIENVREFKKDVANLSETDKENLRNLPILVYYFKPQGEVYLFEQLDFWLPVDLLNKWLRSIKSKGVGKDRGLVEILGLDKSLESFDPESLETMEVLGVKLVSLGSVVVTYDVKEDELQIPEDSEIVDLSRFITQGAFQK